ncbi:hypothetical protein EGT29_07545 [Pigmentiphaga sp. H8]|uniref:hypothetical protein n=1 Tax=unclassified Pigmentiphaga TaxID=2626614 RepID=UPI000F5B2BD6|nr:hypothetical protein [Pigmentiphaga sp. H8]AZG07737.1 hypothetical protein EGT29_07545 [Pigmentiphaga sp. H8]
MAQTEEACSAERLRALESMYERICDEAAELDARKVAAQQSSRYWRQQAEFAAAGGREDLAESAAARAQTAENFAQLLRHSQDSTGWEMAPILEQLNEATLLAREAGFKRPSGPAAESDSIQRQIDALWRALEASQATPPGAGPCCLTGQGCLLASNRDRWG